MKLDSREPNNPIKNGVQSYTKYFNWGIVNSREATKEMFNIFSNQGNANQNNPEIPPYTNPNGWDQNLRWQHMLERM